MMENCGMENLSAHSNLDYKSVMSQVKSMDMLSIGTLVNVL